MLVIEGLHGKSLEVKKYIEGLNEDVLIIITDNSSFDFITPSKIKCYGISVYGIENNMDQFIESLKRTFEQYDFKNVIFDLNVSKDDISFFKNLEEEFGFKSLLTVQPHAREYKNEIKKYQV